MTGSGLVGRGQSSALLTQALADLRRGGGGVTLITGEAGIGKTALLRATVVDARDQHLLVGTGACWDAEAPGWWPWIQALRDLRAAVDDVEWAHVRREAGPALGALLGDDDRVDVAKAEVVGAVTVTLRALARRRPVLVALEDVHWADRASIDLLAAIGRQLTLDAVLIVATARDDEVDADHPLRGALTSTVVPLAGLDPAAVAEMLDAAGATAMGSAAEVRERTGGNPLFVEQLARLWVASGSTTVPAGVGSTIERRLARLPTTSVDVLGVAAICGIGIDPALVARVTAQDRARVVELLGPAIAARLVVDDDSGPHLAHALVREVLVARLDPSEARRLHAAVVEHLPAVAGHDPELSTRLAAHAVHAVPEVPVARAVALSLGAARHASRRLAADEAAGHLRRAIDLLEADPTATAIRLELATVLRRAGRLHAARAELDAVLAAAAASGDAVTHAHAALGMHELGALLGDTERDRQLAALQAASDMLGDAADDALSARVLAAIGRTHAHRLDDDRREMDAITARAVAMARRSGDDATLAFCLLARHDAIWGIAPPIDRVPLAREMEVVAHRAGETELELQAILLQVVVELELADPATLATLDRYGALAERAGLARARYMHLSRRAAFAAMQGRRTEAAELTDAALALGMQIGEIDALSVDIDQRWVQARLRGDLDEFLRTFAWVDEPQMASQRLTAALDRDDIRSVEELAAASARLDARWPRWAATLWMAVTTDEAAMRRDTERCRQLHALIAGHGAAWVVLAGAVVEHGPMARLLGVLDVALGRWDDAVDHLEQARRLSERLGARPWVVLTRLTLAQALIGRGEPADAAVVLAAARHEAVELGMATAVRRAEAIARRLAIDEPTLPANRFVREGSVWTVEFAGRVQHLPPSKGLRDLHELIGRPGRDVPATDLQALDTGPAPARRGDALLDETAKAQYRRRLTQLDAAIERALERHDDARAAHLDVERDALVRELRNLIGLGGRSRRAGDDVERARKAVTARLRDAIARLAAHDAELGDHLRAAVATGNACRYDPPVEITWRT